ncbi:MAG: hypothetical protein JWQ98_1716 [Chlorobi bacterium]|nr:hypothetical protein [Chlorobiota bacterium]
MNASTAQIRLWREMPNPRPRKAVPGTISRDTAVGDGSAGAAVMNRKAISSAATPPQTYADHMPQRIDRRIFRSFGSFKSRNREGSSVILASASFLSRPSTFSIPPRRSISSCAASILQARAGNGNHQLYPESVSPFHVRGSENCEKSSDGGVDMRCLKIRDNAGGYLRAARRGEDKILWR